MDKKLYLSWVSAEVEKSKFYNLDEAKKKPTLTHAELKLAANAIIEPFADKITAAMDRIGQDRISISTRKPDDDETLPSVDEFQPSFSKEPVSIKYGRAAGYTKSQHSSDKSSLIDALNQIYALNEFSAAAAQMKKPARRIRNTKSFIRGENQETGGAIVRVGGAKPETSTGGAIVRVGGTKPAPTSSGGAIVLARKPEIRTVPTNTTGGNTTGGRISTPIIPITVPNIRTTNRITNVRNTSNRTTLNRTTNRTINRTTNIGGGINITKAGRDQYGTQVGRGNNNSGTMGQRIGSMRGSSQVTGSVGGRNNTVVGGNLREMTAELVKRKLCII